MIAIVPVRAALGFAVTLLASSLAPGARAEDASPWPRDGHSAGRLLAGARNGGAVLGRAGAPPEPREENPLRTAGPSRASPRVAFFKCENLEDAAGQLPA